MLPRCTQCQKQWKIKSVLALGFSKDGKDCPYCGSKQYVSADTQRAFTLGYLSLLAVPFLLFKVKLSEQEESFY